MEHSTKIISTAYLSTICYNAGGRWVVYPDYLEALGGLPPVFVNESFWPFIDENCREFHCRHQHLYGSESSGKSRFLATKFLLQAQQPGYFRLLYTRKDKATLKNSTYQLFNDIIRGYGWVDRFRDNKTTLDYQCIATGNTLLAAGIKDDSKLMSIADPSDIWIEEPISKNPINNITMSQYTELNRRLRTPLAEKHLHASYNPISKSSFLYTNFFKKPVYDSSIVAILNASYKTNAFLPVEEKKRIEADALLNPATGKVFTLGRWGDAAGANRWVRTFNPVKHVGHVAYITDAPVCLSYDFNTKPYMPLVCYQIVLVKKWKEDLTTGLKTIRDIIQVRAFKEYLGIYPNNSAKWVSEQFIKDYLEPFGPVPVDYYGDATGQSSVPGFGGDENAFVPVKNALAMYLNNRSKKVLKGNHFLVVARELIEELFAGVYDVEILIDEINCPALAEELDELQEGAVGFDNEKKDGVEKRGHLYSTLSYLVQSYFKHLLKLRGAKGNTDQDEPDNED